MNEFIKERNDILKNLENPITMIKIENYCKKYNITMPNNTEVMLAGLHKARLQVTSAEITDEMKEKSKLWLKEHKYNLDIK